MAYDYFKDVRPLMSDIERYGDLMTDELGEVLEAVQMLLNRLDYINDSEYEQQTIDFANRTLQYLKENTRIVSRTEESHRIMEWEELEWLNEDYFEETEEDSQ